MVRRAVARRAVKRGARKRVAMGMLAANRMGNETPLGGRGAIANALR
jgi:hypothetical protein